MRVVVQRVSKAAVSIRETVKGKIGKGLLILMCVENSDNSSDVEWLVNKISNLRIFDDKEGIMNLSVKDIDGEILIISQFTLYAGTRKGNRPSYIKAAAPSTAIPLYNAFIAKMSEAIHKDIPTGEFGQTMSVSLVNDGPVTIIIDSKIRE